MRLRWRAAFADEVFTVETQLHGLAVRVHAARPSLLDQFPGPLQLLTARLLPDVFLAPTFCIFSRPLPSWPQISYSGHRCLESLVGAEALKGGDNCLLVAVQQVCLMVIVQVPWIILLEHLLLALLVADSHAVLDRHGNTSALACLVLHFLGSLASRLLSGCWVLFRPTFSLAVFSENPKHCFLGW